ncbi:bacteriophage abortive infection AbiH family protein [Bacillus sp. 445_BSPC]|uniref:bacteriophage abortive infection AbiH family protein n=1 Tax=Bacillus sp. 445_BSPC TaxID=1581712 RepID=UPI000662B351|nr:bacteriophage abortive infection AbiH family protein [Bacillus sp. 445_BSPC]
MKRLFIIGNGFDLHHGMKTSYWNFRDYLLETETEILRTMEMFNMFQEDLWSNFEANLANIDVQLMFDYYSDSLVSYADDNWSDRYHHEFQYIIEQDTWYMSYGLISQFVKWICSIDLTTKMSEGIAKCFVEVKDSHYLNFNYTPTLQSLYGIDDEKVLHIHNRVVHERSEIFLGHAVGKPESNLDLDYGDVRTDEAYDSIRQYYATTHKSTAFAIAKNESFFNSPDKYNEIIIMGHSLSDVDLPYIQQITTNLCHENTRWYVSYYSEGEIASHRRSLEKCSISGNKVSFFRLCDL